jgi:hypothetical protein
MDPYDSLEFGTACEALQDRGLLGLSAARDPKWRRVTLQVCRCLGGGLWLGFIGLSHGWLNCGMGGY